MPNVGDSIKQSKRFELNDTLNHKKSNITILQNFNNFIIIEVAEFSFENSCYKLEVTNMPQIKSAIKRVKTMEAANDRNATQMSRLRTAIKKNSK